MKMTKNVKNVVRAFSGVFFVLFCSGLSHLHLDLVAKWKWGIHAIFLYRKPRRFPQIAKPIVYVF